MEGIAALVTSPVALVVVWAVLIVIILGIFGTWAFKNLRRYVIAQRKPELPMERVEKAETDAKEAKKAREAEKKAKKEAEQATKEKAKREAEEAQERAEKAKREAEEAQERAEKAKREAEEAKKAREAEKKAKKEAEQAAKEKARREAKEAKKAREAEKKAKYEGLAKLAIESPVDYDQMRELEEYLRQVQHLRLVLVGGSVKEGTKILVFAQKPIPLINVLREMPPVEQVVKKDKEIRVTLRADIPITNW
ncbi:hypothetical protein M1O13_02430 [Dehalococcoidia bacterium]|nr:hypothetical protein [Dehalococcoidia bacterium]